MPKLKRRVLQSRRARRLGSERKDRVDDAASRHHHHHAHTTPATTQAAPPSPPPPPPSPPTPAASTPVGSSSAASSSATFTPAASSSAAFTPAASSSTPAAALCRVPRTLTRTQLTSSRLPDVTEDYDEKYIITGSQLRAMVAGLQCKKRGCRKEVAVTPVANRWDTTISVDCQECGTNYCHAPPTTFKLAGGEENQYTEVNLQQVYHSLVTGEGRAGLESRSAFLGTGRELTPASYVRHCHFLYNKMESHYNKGMEIIYESVKEFYTSRKMAEPDEDGILDVEVSYDGTWMTRGHKSHIGIGFVLDVYTGIVLDFEVICNYCIACEKRRMKPSNKSHKCHKNFDGNSGAMEAEAAKTLWSRSLSHKLRYITFVGDGDSSAFTAVTQLNNGKGPYENVEVKKEECINHVCKRMGTRLRKMKQDVSVLTKTKTGKTRKMSLLGGRGKVTDEIVNHLQFYYGKAIRDNTGTDIREVYNDLTAPTLLKKCLKGGSQNPNESLHSKVWQKCLKIKHAGYFRVKFASQVTILDHNFGYGKYHLLTSMFGSNPAMEKILKQKEERRLTPKKRKRRHIKKTPASPSKQYQAGAF
ncbi:hypothetical protein O3P69_011014 [Scylla paramamosain]|uniref:Mutator-like transposase domain-containing protein n=1 Tax=Scylla paramamosain TaxID=85552 RepID=A0AAW0S9Y4_SCYPA